MLDAPTIVETTAQSVAIIHLTIPRGAIQKEMDPAIRELFAVLGSQQIKPAGAVFSHHHRMTPDIFDFDVGVPVATAVTPSGRVTAGVLPAATVVRTVYTGSFEGLGAAWQELSAWIAAEQVTAAPDLWECYLRGPEVNPDPSTWRTELNRPIVRR